MASVASEVLKTPESAIEYAISNPRILNVSEMLTQESIQALQQSNPLLYKTLEVFSYGTLNELPKEDSLRKSIQLSPNVLNSFKLRVVILRLDSVRELEDIVIDAIYNKLIKAKLDSKGQFIEVDDWASRDTPVHTIPSIVAVLDEFRQNVAEVRLKALEDADKRDAKVMADRKRAQQTEADLMAARKALDESLLVMNSHEPSTSTRTKASRSGKQRTQQAAPANK
ncbi:hypothetical protein DICVIV_13406 [Dictyocaulus viviparus]|uniref:PCI domain-containing protein n=1 Tax=Dictyocaulus viviparus TaxID=29172 RepID=A0A0D8X7U4_DICVI|nr:hypothetical protein DICVIV_13406 [Dictyocaulus viviparus]